MSFSHKLPFCNPYIFTTRFRRPKIFQTVKSVRSKSQSIKYQKFTPTGCEDIRIRKFEFVTKAHFLCIHGNFGKQQIFLKGLL